MESSVIYTRSNSMNQVNRDKELLEEDDFTETKEAADDDDQSYNNLKGSSNSTKIQSDDRGLNQNGLHAQSYPIMFSTLPTSTSTRNADGDNLELGRRTRGAERVRGIRNHGNTCFINVVLQALAIVFRELSSFLDALVEESKHDSNNSSNCREISTFLWLLKNILEKLNETSKSTGAVDVSELVKTLRELNSSFFGTYSKTTEQSDAHEFLCFVLDLLTPRRSSKHIQVLPADLVYPSMIKAALFHGLKGSKLVSLGDEMETKIRCDYSQTKQPPFMGRMMTKISCILCNHVSKCEISDFSCLSLPLMQNDRNFPFRRMNQAEPKSGLITNQMHLNLFLSTREVTPFLPQSFLHFSCPVDTVQRNAAAELPGHLNLCNLIKMAFELEILEDVTCDKCNAKRMKVKEAKVLSWPNFLFLHLNRLSFDERLQQIKKCDAFVEFPEFLDVTGLCEASSNRRNAGIYSLQAVIVHHGSSGRGGHFFMYKRNLHPTRNYHWFHISDDLVVPVTRKEVFSSKLYLALYSRWRIIRLKPRPEPVDVYLPGINVANTNQLCPRLAY